jgi:hypothetical protein
MLAFPSARHAAGRRCLTIFLLGFPSCGSLDAARFLLLFFHNFCERMSQSGEYLTFDAIVT